ncbi:hypothetical protein ABMA27_002972 [Loxostege sticticalis]|uniref:Uncharacterized protein n=1 Tax=Loxostege sticticalis TaxID=481309 RepID=A0ABR3HRL5_LOXSC
MSKRPALPQYGDRKKPKLDISRSDHHLPLSQNICTIVKEDNCDVWGDDDEEQMLLQASQACEEEQNNDISMLPDYSNWKQPGSTSTQYQSSPSTSKTTFEFKKPNSFLPNAISTHLKNKCNTISSPLPGISTMTRDRNSNLTDDLAISDKIMSGQDDICRRMLLLEEENNKLKSEYQKLSDKIFTKEGEASILRSQLKASQLANDNARMEKIRAQEKIQMECNEKLAAITKEMQNLKAQLEFKDLEILSVKDKFKKLEANKLRLTQVNEISSHRNNNTLTALNNTMTQQKAKMTSNSVQTEDKAPFVKLNKEHFNTPHSYHPLYMPRPPPPYPIMLSEILPSFLLQYCFVIFLQQKCVILRDIAITSIIICKFYKSNMLFFVNSSSLIRRLEFDLQT